MKGRNAIKRLICSLCVFSLILALIPFSKAGASDGVFGDVSDTQYFFTAVNSMFQQGVVNGCGDGTFLPQNPVKHSEAIKMICSLAGITYAGCSGKSSPWYADVITWAEDNGIMSADIDPNSYATREEICLYIARVYKISTSVNTNAFSDTDSAVANTLYNYGIISGIKNPDGTVSFDGTANVKRCDACVMLYRLSGKVTKPEWDSFVPDRSHYNVARPNNLTCYDDYVQAWSYMLTHAVFSDSYTLHMTCTKDDIQSIADKLQKAYNFAMFNYMEYASFLNIWEVKTEYSCDSRGNCYDPTFELKLSNGFGLSDNETATEIDAFNVKCAQIVSELYKNGELNSGMSSKDKALVLFKYIAGHTKYDDSYKYYNGYDAAIRGTAVCQGYTSMYNYLCNLAGVAMECMTGKINGSGHAWSRIYSSGTYYNVDCTWGDNDQSGPCDETFFWVTDDFLKTYNPPRTFDCDTLVYGE